VNEGDIGPVTATLSVTLSTANSRTVTVNWATAAGTATAGSDYTSASGSLSFAAGETSKTVSVTVLGDTVDEADETFFVNLSNPSNAVLGDGQGVGTVVDDDVALPSLTVGDVTVTEGHTGTVAATFTVSLSFAPTTPVQVAYATATNTAVAGSDYTAVSDFLNFAAGETTKTVIVQVLGDVVDEMNETFFLNLTSAVGANISDGQGVGTVTDDDTATVTISDAAMSEGDIGIGAIGFAVTLSTPSDRTVTVNWATGTGTATAGTDYTAAGGTLTFTPGETFKTVGVSVQGDTVDENDETLLVDLSGLTGATFADNQGVGTITDDDTASAALSDVNINEGNSGTGTAAFTVTLTNASDRLITVSYATADGSATTAGNDYLAASGTLTFAPGQTSRTVNVTVRGDTTFEPDETFFLRLSNPSNVVLGDTEGVGTIVGDDAEPRISINNITANETDGATVATFNITLNSASYLPIAVDFATANITTSDLDYYAASGTLTFAPGETAKTVTVNVRGDILFDPGEQFALDLSHPVNATLNVPCGDCTIIDDEHAPVSVAGADQNGDESTIFWFDGTGSYDVDGDTLIYTWDFGDGTTWTGQAQPFHIYRDNGTYTVTLTIDDGTGGVTSDTLTVTVANLAPIAYASGVNRGVPGQPRSFTFSNGEWSLADRAAGFDYVIDWGHETQTLHLPMEGVALEHEFPAPGTYAVTLTVLDKDGGAGSAAVTMTVVVAELQGGQLAVGGTAGDDTITLRPAPNGQVQATVNGVDAGTFAPTLHYGNTYVRAYGHTGNDTIELLGAEGVSATFPYAALLFGGEGSDVLDARAAARGAALSGGAGHDVLLGGIGADLLIGGYGADVLRGGDGEDLPIGNHTAHDNNYGALWGLLGEWANSNHDFATRQQYISGQLSGGVNGSTFLNAQSVFDDGVIDDLHGEAGADWFFTTYGTNADRLNDLGGSDAVTVL
jgi:PKD repeat protein